MSDTISALVTVLETGNKKDWLDDMVNDLKDNEASNINNGGIKAQVEYIVSQCKNETEAVKFILDRLN